MADTGIDSQMSPRYELYLYLIIRRILRYDHPTGKGMEDLRKIAHEIELIMELEYGEGNPVACCCEKPDVFKQWNEG